MNIVFVVSHMRDWPFKVPGITVIHARNYLMDPAWASCNDTKVFNLCSSYDYQGRGYYVSLLGEARGHQPLPDVKAIEEIQSGSAIKSVMDNLGDLIQLSFAHLDSPAVDLEIYFGRSINGDYEKLCEQLFNILHTPLLSVRFARIAERWTLVAVQVIRLPNITASARKQLINAAIECLHGHRKRMREPAAKRPRMAILLTPGEEPHPSGGSAIQKFIAAADSLGMDAEIIAQSDAGRLGEFDGLFIRDTTRVNHTTYQIARQSALAGLVVIDDPDSILRCANKVFLTELLTRHRVPIPKTLLVHKDNAGDIIASIGLPCVLKQPDGAFSAGVIRVNTEQELETGVNSLLAQSAIILAQEYLPTEYDWRVGILDRRALFVCKYFMAKGHWQIIKHEKNAVPTEGAAEALSIGEVPGAVISIALKAANLIGDGFYGVDLKQIGNRVVVIEINDNPNVDAGNEDGVLKDALYREVMGVFRKRIEAAKNNDTGNDASSNAPEENVWSVQ